MVPPVENHASKLSQNGVFEDVVVAGGERMYSKLIAVRDLEDIAKDVDLHCLGALLADITSSHRMRLRFSLGIILGASLAVDIALQAKNLLEGEESRIGDDDPVEVWHVLSYLENIGASELMNIVEDEEVHVLEAAGLHRHVAGKLRRVKFANNTLRADAVELQDRSGESGVRAVPESEDARHVLGLRAILWLDPVWLIQLAMTVLPSGLALHDEGTDVAVEDVVPSAVDQQEVKNVVRPLRADVVEEALAHLLHLGVEDV